MHNYKRVIKAILSPNVMVDSIKDIDLQDYYNQGFRQIFLDVDNTIMAFSEDQCSLDNEKWVKDARKIGFNIYVVSNNSNWLRIYRFAKQTGLNGYYFAGKPLTFTGRFILNQDKLNTKETLVIGDQLLTDVIFGNWLGSYTILVDPMDRKSNPIKRVQYSVESKLLEWIGLK